MMENLFAWYLSFIVLRIASAISAIEGSFPSQWVNDTYGGGHLCSEDLGVCRTFAHFVFVTTPSDASHILLGGAHFAFEDGEYQVRGVYINRFLYFLSKPTMNTKHFLFYPFRTEVTRSPNGILSTEYVLMGNVSTLERAKCGIGVTML